MKEKYCLDILEILEKEEDCSQEDLVSLLRCDDPKVTEKLFTVADAKRKKYVGDAVHLRGLIEFSNFCRKNCFYCGLRKENKKLERYRMSPKEIYTLCERVARLGIKTIVLQSGEDPWYEAKAFAELIHRVKKLGVAITLSVGEREPWEYALWRDAGADRYLLKQETFDRQLFTRLHPDDDYDRRLHCQKVLKDLGYQVGSGNMVGLPYQTYEALALDIKKFQEWDFDMIGIGPFIPHPDTPLGQYIMDPEKKCLLTLKVLALTRILTKTTNLPATTALGTLVPEGRERGLRCGANVLMPNFTPAPYRTRYTIYPGKICVRETWGNCLPCMEKMVRELGRTIATDFGDRIRSLV